MVQLMCSTHREVGVEIKTLPGAVIKKPTKQTKKKMEERKDAIKKAKKSK